MYCNPFSDGELSRRLDAVRREMAARRLDMAVFSAPESVFYLTGLDHWGYFAAHLLLVPLEGEMTLITRAMEQVTVERQVRNARFVGHRDNETAIDTLIGLLEAAPRRHAGPAGGVRVVGLEEGGSGLPLAARRVLDSAPAGMRFQDISGLCDGLRMVKSAEEMALMRRAARVSDAAMAAAREALHDGAREADIAAETLAAMARAGGAPPGFGPFIRPGARLGEEHATWGNGVVRHGERVFVELAGCVGRYHAPLGRLFHLGAVPEADARMAETCRAAFEAVRAALVPGAEAREVYAAWQDVVDTAGLRDYRRHHCGYAVGIGVPPSWTGGNSVVGLRHDSRLRIRTGMSFHVLSWLMNTGRGDFFLSNTVLLGPAGAEVLTTAPAGPVAA